MDGTGDGTSERFRRHTAPRLVFCPPLLHAIGLADRPDRLRLKLIDRAGDSDNIRIHKAGIKTNGPVFHMKTPIERKVLLFGSSCFELNRFCFFIGLRYYPDNFPNQSRRVIYLLVWISAVFSYGEIMEVFPQSTRVERPRVAVRGGNENILSRNAGPIGCYSTNTR